MAMNFDEPPQTTGKMLQDYINTAGPEDVAGSDALVNTLFDENPAATANVPATETIAESDGVDFTTISPNPEEPITEFYKRTGHGSVEEFIQDPNNQGKIGRNSKGVLFVRENVEYRVKPNNAPSNGINIDGEQITMQEGGTNEYGILGKETDNAFEDSSGIGTKRIDTGVDLGAEPTKNIDLPDDLAKGAVIDKPLPDTITKKISSKNLLNNGLTPDYIMRVISETFLTDDPTVKTAFEQYKTDISLIKFDNESELRTLLDKQQKEITSEINSYQTKIDAVAKEEFVPKLKGFNKFMAVLGAALGSFGSSMTGTPNFALNILNKAIDRDAQEFADSKEMRVSTLEQQRLALRERRGQLLGMAENAVTRLQNTVNTKLATAESVARVQQLQEQITSAKDESFRGFLGDLAAMMSTQAIGQDKIDAALFKEEKELRVEGIELPNEKGEMVVLQPFLAKTKEQQVKLTKFMTDTAMTNDDLNEMKKLFSDPKKWLPAVFSDTKKALDYYHNRILLRVKFMNNMGANFTVSEQIMIKSIIPEANITGRLGTAIKAAELMQRSLFTDIEKVKKFQGATPITTPSLYTTNTNNSQSVPTLTKISNK
tara:strand:+ start:73 stop:1875 length:1803 start_codon:yes stop_codon:yes gene_type:complete